MAAKKGAGEAARAIVAVATEYAYGVTLLGGAMLIVAGGSFYAAQLRKDLKAARMDLETARREARLSVENARLEGCVSVENARLACQRRLETAEAKVEAARRETAEKFLKYGFGEDYLNYQQVMKLHQQQQPGEFGEDY